MTKETAGGFSEVRTSSSDYLVVKCHVYLVVKSHDYNVVKSHYLVVTCRDLLDVKAMTIYLVVKVMTTSLSKVNSILLWTPSCCHKPASSRCCLKLITTNNKLLITTNNKFIFAINTDSTATIELHAKRCTCNGEILFIVLKGVRPKVLCTILKWDCGTHRSN